MQQIWNRQKDFQYNFYNPDNLKNDERIVLTKEYILCIHRELGEILNNIPWKKHRKNNKRCNIKYLKEELIDCFKFLLNLCIIWKMNSHDFEKLFFEKSRIVEFRFKKEFKEYEDSRKKKTNAKIRKGSIK